MYTIHPLPPIDTINNHVGLIFIVFLIFLISLVLSMNQYMTDDNPFFKHFCTYLVSLGVVIGLPSAYISYHTGDIKYYDNTPVEATLTDIHSAEWNTMVKEGKTTKTVTVNGRYISYKVPEGIVTFTRTDGVPYPERAILYKN